MTKKETFYWGDQEILGVTEQEHQTPLGDPFVEVLLADNKKLIVTKRAFEAVRSTEPLAPDNTPGGRGGIETQIRARKVTPLVKEMLTLMTETNLELGEVNYTIELLINSININVETASNKLWNVEDANTRTLVSIDRVLKTNPGTE